MKKRSLLFTIASLVAFSNIHAQSDSTSRLTVSIRIASGLNLYHNREMASYKFEPNIGSAFQIQGTVDYNFKRMALESGLRIGQRGAYTSLASKARTHEINTRELLFVELPLVISYKLRNRQQKQMLSLKGGAIIGSGYLNYKGREITPPQVPYIMFNEGPPEFTYYSSAILGVDKEAVLSNGNRMVIGLEYSQQLFMSDQRSLAMNIDNQPKQHFTFLSHALLLSCGFKF